jgi:aminoglycoside phosphotransferase (APT) family kinase protein
LIKVLATLHQLSIESVGLSALAQHEGYIERQLNRWFTQYRKSSEEIDQFVPGIDAAFHDLRAQIPEQRGVSIVHGDYRLDNTVIDASGGVAAVLDWEICTLGDPLADLGLLMVYWTNDSDERSALGRATTLEGFWSRSQLAEYYRELTGADTSAISFYVAFAYWKLACILQGVYSRYLQGAQGGDQSDVTGYGDQVAWLAQRAQENLSS